MPLEVISDFQGCFFAQKNKDNLSIGCLLGEGIFTMGLAKII